MAVAGSECGPSCAEILVADSCIELESLLECAYAVCLVSGPYFGAEPW